MESSIYGQIISGEVGKILIREKSGKKIELGDLLVFEDAEGKSLLQVYNLIYGSQISRGAIEQISGLNLEGFGTGTGLFDPELRNYTLAQAKAVLRMTGKVNTPKTLPDFFGIVRNVTPKDLKFLTEKKKSPLFIGNVRRGSKVLDISVHLEGLDVIPHHILICSTTGRGKSNLVKNMLWNSIGDNQIGVLILDAHDEYYGNGNIGLNDHPRAPGNLVYYSVNPPPGANSLIINLASLRSEHFEGIIDFSEAQQRMMSDYITEYGQRWIENIIQGSEIPDSRPHTATLRVLQQIFRSKLSLSLNDEGSVYSRNRIFSTGDEGESTVNDIIRFIEEGRIVIIDTSRSADEVELLIGSMVANGLLSRHQNAKADGALDDVIPASIVVEEASRVLGKEKLEKSGNIFSTIAREGRKFKIGLVAVTQLVSVIPQDILTNINTKIILGNELASERNALIQSAAQDLSEDNRNIASLDKGEAIISSIFTKFAVPIKIPLFEEIARPSPRHSEKVEYAD